MLVDYERAWLDLVRYVLTKPNHGQAGLLAELARLQARHCVAEGSLPALLRLYGVEVQSADMPPDDEGDAFPPAVASEPHRHLSPGGRHAGSNQERTAA